ncbi:uncharacterized protein ATC70_002714 [Mucor velutinosus]|uniref:Uncharacterized protein n=1 Tax=Mucor velutinosus TaxID=708070 RepID=A0AAN7HMI1_9FUNG|nr:hypothetical protein ATC70_002714 [Mucor velutinosus]
MITIPLWNIYLTVLLCKQDEQAHPINDRRVPCHVECARYIYHRRIDTYKIKKLDEMILASCQISTNNNVVVTAANGITKVPLSKRKASSSQALMLGQPAKNSECLANM